MFVVFPVKWSFGNYDGTWHVPRRPIVEKQWRLRQIIEGCLRRGRVGNDCDSRAVTVLEFGLQSGHVPKRSLLEKEWGPGHVIKMSFFGIRPDICSGSYRMEVLELWREVGLL